MIKSMIFELFRKYKYLFVVLLFCLGCNLFAHYQEISNDYAIYPDAAYIPTIATLVNEADVLIMEEAMVKMIKMGHYLGPKEIWEMVAYAKQLSVFTVAIADLCFFLLRYVNLWALMLVQVIFANVLATIYMFKLGDEIKGGKIGFFVAILYVLYSLTMDSFYGMQPRHIGHLLFVMYIFYFVLGKDKVCFVLSVLSLVFYPYNFIVMSIALFIKRVKKENCIIYLGGLLFIVGVIFLLGGWGGISIRDILFGKFVLGYKYYFKTGVQAENWKIFVISGNMFLNLQEHTLLYKYFTFLLLLFNMVLSVLGYRKQKKIDKNLYILLLSGILAFFVSWVFIDISVASRMLIFVVPLLLIIFFVLNLDNVCYIFDIKLSFFKVMIFLFPFVMLFFLKFQSEVLDLSKSKPIFSFLETIPKAATIAGHPSSLEFVPLYSKRKIILLDRIHRYFPFNEDIKKKFEDVENDLLSSIYADSLDLLKKFVKKYDISHVLLDKKYYSEGYLQSKHWHDLEMTNLRKILGIIEKTNKSKKFAVWEFAKGNYIFEDNGVFIFETKSLFNKEN